MKIENIIVEWINNEYELDVISRQQLFLKYLEIWLQDSIVQKNKNFNNFLL